MDSANRAEKPVVSGPAECRRACGQAHAGFRVRGLRCFVTGLALLLGLVAHAPLLAGVAALATIECKVDGRMVELPGGDQPANHEDHPWQVALQLDGNYVGGGVLHDAGWVLTTGHLVVDAIATRLTVVCGEVNPRDFGKAEQFAVEGSLQVNSEGARDADRQSRLGASHKSVILGGVVLCLFRGNPESSKHPEKEQSS